MAFLAKIIVLITVLLIGQANAFADTHDHSHHLGSELEAEPFSPDSLYQVESTWRSANGNSMKLGALRDRPRIVTMFYASCTVSCPVIVENLRKIERYLSQTQVGKPGFVLVTFDTTHDTPEKLKAFATKRGLNAEDWLLLRGDEEDTLELAVLLGMKYKQTADGNFSHSNIIALLDGNGRIIYRHVGLTLDDAILEEFASSLKKMSEYSGSQSVR